MSETFSYTPAVLASLAGEAKACVERGDPDLLAVMCHDLLPWAGHEDVDRVLGTVLKLLLRHAGAMRVAEIEAEAFPVDRLRQGWNPQGASIAYLSWKYRQAFGPERDPDLAQAKMLVAAGDSILDIDEGTAVIVDAERGWIDVDPPPSERAAAEATASQRAAENRADLAGALDPAVTVDGVRIVVKANLGTAEEARAAVAAGAEGCGLLRTEFLFLDRDTPPGQDEQQRIYRDIAAVLGNRPLIVRTLDIGADKNVPYVALGREDNPALGLRGVRLSFARPDLLVTQLNAILAGVPPEQCRVMLPMVTEVDELRQVRRLLDAASQAAGRTDRIPLGVMIETPASAVLADSIAVDADFLSVGTNDLTQYVLAADRGNAAVSARADALHPAVLRLIRQAAEGAHRHDRWIGVCGGIASDPIAAAVLIGLGVTELSVAPAAVPAIKAAVRNLRTEDCRKLAERACAAASAHEVRSMAAEALE